MSLSTPTSGPQSTPLSADPALIGETPRALATAALQGLLVMLTLMTGALWAGVPPHPPADKAPLIAAIAALCWLALALLRARHPRAWIAVVVAALAALPAFGPHKFWLEPQAAVLSPVIVSGSALIALLAVGAWRLRATLPVA